MLRAVGVFLLAAVTLGVCVVGAAPMAASAPPSRIVAVGDIHGDLDAFIEILQHASLLDGSAKWSGGTATLVQLGDMIDRGPKSRAVLDFLMALQKDARRTDGHVIVVLGNHEVMNLYGDLRYVTAADYASYAGADSERRRSAAYDAYTKLAGDKPAQSREDWMAAHPPGFVEQREAMAPDGKYGRWLRSLPAVAKVEDSLFLHGGVADDFASWSVSRLNDRVATELKAFDDVREYLVAHKLAVPISTMSEVLAGVGAAAERKDEAVQPMRSFDNWLTITENGPLWFRGYARLGDAEVAMLADRVLSAMSVRRVVVGHTPQAGEIVQRVDGKINLVDTGMLRGYVEHGRASALDIQGGRVQAIYTDGTKTLK